MQLKTLTPLMAGILLLASCQNENYTGPDKAGNKLTVMAGINELQSRLSESGITWTVGDAIGVSDNLSSQPSLNIRYTATTTAGAFDSSTGIYILGSGDTQYTAYYPYKGTEGTSAGILNFSITDASGNYLGNDSTDFMFAQASAKREDATVNFQFDHKMSKVVLNIVDSKNNDTSTGITYTLKGVTTDGQFNTTDGTVTTGKTTGKVTAESTLGKISSIILPPAAEGTTPKFDIVVKIGDKGYSGTISPALASGTQYTYNIDIAKINAGKFLTIDSPTISGWSNVDMGDVPMREDINYNPTLEVGDFICKDGSQIDKDYALTPSMKQQIVGVVFYTGNAQPSAQLPEKYTSSQDILKKEAPTAVNGLAIALNNAQTDPDRFANAKFNYGSWFTTASNAASFIGDGMNASATPTIMMGYNNTRLIETAIKSVGDYTVTGGEAFETLLNNFRKANAVEEASEWFLPSYAELKALQDNYATVSASIQKAGGSLPQYSNFADTPTETFYWSSDLRGNSYNWVSPLVETSSETNLYVSRASGGTKGYFRFVIAF